jgi:hypothetical protein
MQSIQFFNSSSSSSSLVAVAPVVHQEYLTISAGTGATPQDLLNIPAGDCSAYGGQIVNKGCYDLQADITYLTGGDCDSCTVDTLTTEVISIYIPANSVFPIPDGFYQLVQVSTVDSSKTAISNTTDVTVSLHSAHSPSCGGCVQAQ